MLIFQNKAETLIFQAIRAFFRIFYLTFFYQKNHKNALQFIFSFSYFHLISNIMNSFSLIIPKLLRDDAEHLPQLNTPFLNEIIRFASFQTQTQNHQNHYNKNTGELLRSSLAMDLSLAENQVYVSPLYQQMGMNSMQVIDVQEIDLEQAQTLCADLTAFYENELIFEAQYAHLWVMTLPQKCDWQAPELWAILGKQDGFNQFSAQGNQRKQWLQCQTEIQMWLHTHPINKIRENNQLPPINAVWLWNAPPSLTPNPLPRLVGCDSIWKQNSSLQHTDLPYDFAAWQAICAEKNIALQDTYLILDDLIQSYYTGDIWTYQQILENWDKRFFEPILKALKNQEIHSFKIICEQGILAMNSRSHWAFWKKSKSFNGLNF